MSAHFQISVDKKQSLADLAGPIATENWELQHVAEIAAASAATLMFSSAFLEQVEPVLGYFIGFHSTSVSCRTETGNQSMPFAHFPAADHFWSKQLSFVGSKYDKGNNRKDISMVSPTSPLYKGGLCEMGLSRRRKWARVLNGSAIATVSKCHKQYQPPQIICAFFSIFSLFESETQKKTLSSLGT
eukprot:s526_g33.t1